MKSISSAFVRRTVFAITVFALTAITFSMIFTSRHQASLKTVQKGVFERGVSHQKELPNYDIRSDKAAFEKIASFRTTLNRTASDIADRREKMVNAEDKLRAAVPSLKIEYNPELFTPEIISPDPAKGQAFLSRPSNEKRSGSLMRFLREHKELIGAETSQVEELKLFADYKNPDGNLGFVEYEQELNGIPVFRGQIKAAFSKNGEIIRVVNNFAPGLDSATASTDFGDPANALNAAASHIGSNDIANKDSIDLKRSTPNKVFYGEGDWAPTAEKMYFPAEPGVAVPAWRVLIWQPQRAYYVIVDARDGTLLWRKNITEDQSQQSVFDVYVNPNSLLRSAASPAPVPPTVFDPNSATQGTLISRTPVTRIGNESPYNFNNNGWINDATNLTIGNNVESGMDLSSPDGIDAGTQAEGIPYRNFTSNWNPPPGDPAPGDLPSLDSSRRGAVIQQFYIMNLYHDELYRLGFTEQARNFQTSNFNRGGLGGDSISAEGQDFASVNNANFGTGADGVRGKMQMFIFTGPIPQRDGTGDADIMVHEVTHGTSNRLVGNAAGLTSTMARALGEGWSDFYSHCLLSEPSDPINGTYAMTGYLLLNGYGAVGTANHYYGIRRFPTAIMSSTGGPNNRPHNPLTFADIDQTKKNTSDGAFPAMFGAHISTEADQVHAAGEIWSIALWEIRARMVQRLGWEQGNRRILQLVTDAMKISPQNPTFLQARDAVIISALGSATTTDQLNDAADAWAGFAVRGLGVNASIQVNGSGIGNTRVTESFDRPNLLQTPTFSVSDAQGDNDGIVEPGETITISIPLSNITSQNATGVTGQIAGAGSASYGTISTNSTVSRQFTYTVPELTDCGALLSLTLTVNSSLGSINLPINIPTGLEGNTLSQNFDAVSAPNLPAGWSTSVDNGGIPFVTSSSQSDSAPNSAFSASAAATGSSYLTSPQFLVESGAATVTFRHRYIMEPTFDGGVLEISFAGGDFQDILTAGGSFLAGGYNGSIHPDTFSPIAGRQAWSNVSDGFVTAVAQLPASAYGQQVRLRWRQGTDANTIATGWNIDSVVVRATSSCSFVTTTRRARADFDGDGKSDWSVFRPSNGNWYVAGSLQGMSVVSWGVSGDEPAPGDFDGDGKTDHAIFRPSPGTSPDFYIIKSNGFVISTVSWGEPGDKPVIGDYDGDGSDDVAVYRASNNTWYVVKSSGGLDISTFGEPGDIPVPGNYDDDDKTDRAVYRSGQWFVAQSTGGMMTANWGVAGDIPVQADYDGDGRDDIALWRPSNGTWYIRRSSNFQFDIISWGQNGDIPAPGDYDGDGKYDPTVFRNGVWYTLRSLHGMGQSFWGAENDIPIPAKYVQ